MFRKPCFQTFSELSDSKTGFLTPKQVFWPKIRFFWPKNRFFFDPKELFLQKICELEKNCYFGKIPELRKMNFSETSENKKFGNFRLMQGHCKIYEEITLCLVIYRDFLFLTCFEGEGQYHRNFIIALPLEITSQRFLKYHRNF